jgi:hypothetical protein
MKMRNKFTYVSAKREIGMQKENYGAPICLYVQTKLSTGLYIQSRGEENVLGAREDSSILRYFLFVVKANFRSLVFNSF